jgi:signal transduction histidine kinase/phage shock protein PspC (stress-responsive transcriptional regulator)
MAHAAAPDAPTPAAPRLVEAPRTRRSADRILLGVVGGFARRWRVDPTLLRAAVGLLALAGGIGVALYVVGIALSDPHRTTNGGLSEAAPIQRRNFAVCSATLAVLLAARVIGLWPGNEVMIPAAVVAVAVVVIWAPAAATAAPAAATADKGGIVRRLSSAPLVRWLIGAILAVAGVAALADRTGGLSDVGRSVSAIAIALAGIGVIAAPALGRLLSNLDTERTLRVREEERAALAAHLHDSVLQSLVLIQRADDPRRMVSLARRQERELRSWLYGAGSVGEPSSLTAAVESMAAAIEVDHEMRVEAVIVGDAPLDETARVFLGALREAATNAARHSGADHIDVYVEADLTELAGFVRDTGIGFDPAAVPADRHGVVDSIIGRIDRAGGRVVVTSHPGDGTEVEIQLPRPRVMRVGPQT